MTDERARLCLCDSHALSEFTTEGATKAPPHDLHSRETLWQLCRRLCYQLSSSALGPRLAEQSVKNLLYVSVAAYQSTPAQVGTVASTMRVGEIRIADPRFLRGPYVPSGPAPC